MADDTIRLFERINMLEDDIRDLRLRLDALAEEEGRVFNLVPRKYELKKLEEESELAATEPSVG